MGNKTEDACMNHLARQLELGNKVKPGTERAYDLSLRLTQIHVSFKEYAPVNKSQKDAIEYTLKTLMAASMYLQHVSKINEVEEYVERGRKKRWV